MASNSQTFRELQSLRDELSTARRERPSPAVSPPSSPQPDAGISVAAANGSAAADPPKGAAEQDQRGEDIHELVNEATKFFEEAEKNMYAHPATVAISALVVGMFIGWMLRRR